MSRQLKPCGTPPAYRRHLYHHEVPCEACLLAVREESREAMRRRRAKPTTPRELAPHGSIGAYQRHKRRAETPCELCLDGWAEYIRAWREARAA